MERLVSGHVAEHPFQDIHAVRRVTKKQVTVRSELVPMYQGGEQACSGRTPSVGEQSRMVDVRLLLRGRLQLLRNPHGHVTHAQDVTHGLSGTQVRGQGEGTQDLRDAYRLCLQVRGDVSTGHSGLLPRRRSGSILAGGRFRRKWTHSITWPMHGLCRLYLKGRSNSTSTQAARSADNTDGLSVHCSAR